MRLETCYCDNCKEETQYYFEISKLRILAANGKNSGTTIGRGVVNAENLIFCCVECLYEYFNSHHKFKTDHLFFPGDQVRHPKYKNEICGK